MVFSYICNIRCVCVCLHANTASYKDRCISRYFYVFLRIVFVLCYAWSVWICGNVIWAELPKVSSRKFHAQHMSKLLGRLVGCMDVVQFHLRPSDRNSEKRLEAKRSKKIRKDPKKIRKDPKKSEKIQKASGNVRYLHTVHDHRGDVWGGILATRPQPQSTPQYSAACSVLQHSDSLLQPRSTKYM